VFGIPIERLNMKKKILLLVVLSLVMSTAYSARNIGIGVGRDIGPSPRSNYIARIPYKSISGNYHYIKLITASTLITCQNYYGQELNAIISSPIWELDGAPEWCHAN
jgi:predicted small secreted protein